MSNDIRYPTSHNEKPKIRAITTDRKTKNKEKNRTRKTTNIMAE